MKILTTELENNGYVKLPIKDQQKQFKSQKEDNDLNKQKLWISSYL